jgi:hypothetical protein
MGEYKYRTIASPLVSGRRVFGCDWVGTAGSWWYQQRPGTRRIDGIDDVLGTHELLMAGR